jgi:hypothetical protein
MPGVPSALSNRRHHQTSAGKWIQESGFHREGRGKAVLFEFRSQDSMKISQGFMVSELTLRFVSQQIGIELS